MNKKSILIIESNYYKQIAKNLLLGAKNVLDKEKKDFDVITVPGALEISCVLEKFKNSYKGFIILGCVIRGETSHYEIVTNVSSKIIYDIVRINQLALGFGLITANDMNQAIERSNIKKRNLGSNAARVCSKMIEILKKSY